MGLKVAFLAVGMLLFGTINTITTKFQVWRPECGPQWQPLRCARPPPPPPRARGQQSGAAPARLPARAAAVLTGRPPLPPRCPALQDIVVVGYTKDGTPITFQHPVVQVGRRGAVPRCSGGLAPSPRAPTRACRHPTRPPP
jgi:hypothetical protein